MTWKCAKCASDNLDYLDVCRTCGTGKDGQIKIQQRFEAWEKETGGIKPPIDISGLSSIIISTGDLKEPYHILDAVFALDYHTGGFLSGTAPSKAFDGVKTKLRQICKEMGGDAVINCQFEYRIALAITAGGAVASVLGKVVGANISEKSQAIEIFAYGTAVKLKNAGM